MVSSGANHACQQVGGPPVQRTRDWVRYRIAHIQNIRPVSRQTADFMVSVEDQNPDAVENRCFYDRKADSSTKFGQTIHYFISYPEARAMAEPFQYVFE